MSGSGKDSCGGNDTHLPDIGTGSKFPSHSEVTRPAESTEERAARAERLVGYSYRMPDFYEVGREKVREYATAVQNAHPAHYDEQAARDLGHSALVAP